MKGFFQGPGGDRSFKRLASAFCFLVAAFAAVWGIINNAPTDAVGIAGSFLGAATLVLGVMAVTKT